MTRFPAFWDSSALVPLCLQQSNSPAARAQLRRFPPVVWWGSPVELASAVCRLYRTGDLSKTEKEGAITRLHLLHRSSREIQPGDDLRAAALQCLETYDLRAADSLQLAAALIWCAHRPARRYFLCSDKRLIAAAKSAGFSTIPI